MATISTHVLDATAGSPARGLGVTLERDAGRGAWEHVGQGVTDRDGRIESLLAHETVLTGGIYRLTFDSGAYFRSRTGTPPFLPFVHVVFEVEPRSGRVHVPLLLGPFGYTTYRGS